VARLLHAGENVTKRLLYALPALLLAIAAATLLIRWRSGAWAPLVPTEEIVLERQNRALQQLVSVAESGALLNFEQVLVVVDQKLVQDLLSAATPLEGDVGNGFHVRIDSAESTFGDGVALVRLNGLASVAGRSASAAISVYGGLDVVELDRSSGRLRCQVSVYNVEATHSDILGFDLRRLSQALAEGGLARLLHFIEIPVRIEDRLEIPAITSGRIRIPSAEVPLQAGVREVKVFGGKLWISVGAVLAPVPPHQPASFRAAG
jgi:hypothetical protein